MKLKFERFEGIASFSIRGKVELSELRILAVGIETLTRSLEEPLIINFTQAEIAESFLKPLIDVKKILTTNSKQKLYWIGKGKGLSDYLDLSLLFSRMGGFKLRQIGERLTLEDDLFKLNAQIEVLKAAIEKLGGEGDQAHKIILENQILREQNRVFKSTLKIQDDRMKLQNSSPASDPEHDQKVKTLLEDLKTVYGTEVNL
jgi:hypothetical protein